MARKTAAKKSESKKTVRYTLNGKKTTRRVPTDKEIEQWFKDAENVTPDTIGDFVKKLYETPQTYGTFVKAIAACMCAGGWAMGANGSSHQFGCAACEVLASFGPHIIHVGEKLGFRILDYDRILHKYTAEQLLPMKIRREKWDEIVDVAKKILKDNDETYLRYGEDREWIKNLADGKRPDGLTLEDCR